jgi:hypothetical protein
MVGKLIAFHEWEKGGRFFDAVEILPHQIPEKTDAGNLQRYRRAE